MIEYGHRAVAGPHTVELEKQAVWAALPRRERMAQAAAWYATTNARDLHSGNLVAWSLDPNWQREWRAKTRRSVAAFIMLQVGTTAPELQAVADLEAVRRTFREHVDTAVALAAAHQRVAELSAQLLADPAFASAVTAELDLPTRRAAS